MTVWTSFDAFGANAFATRARFGVTIAVGGGLGCPYGKAS